MYKSNHGTVEAATSESLSVKLHDSIGGDEALKKELLLLASNVHHKSIKKVLIDNTKLAHPLSADMQRWAELSVELPMLRCGVDKIAIVTPKSQSVFALTSHNNHERKRYFKSVTSAKKWLDK